MRIRTIVVTSAVVYVVSWSGWFASTNGYHRQWHTFHPGEGVGLAGVGRVGDERREADVGETARRDEASQQFVAVEAGMEVDQAHGARDGRGSFIRAPNPGRA